MIEIDNFSTKKESGMQDVQGPVEADPEYLLIVEVNNLAAQIDEEIGMVKTMFISTLYFQILYLPNILLHCINKFHYFIASLQEIYTSMRKTNIVKDFQSLKHLSYSH